MAAADRIAREERRVILISGLAAHNAT